ncbi:hypothetical protein L195_g050202 [Trifolium pratense]|uniref:Uncharacterized protein n=1 Tax=Trifolium pratense TaxID=57577 RepID=A0A2K3JSP2_TRIPR|nr:hypothetical protein L195_g050202 [Trifolium pratense]
MAGVNNHQVPEHVAENNVQPMDYAPYRPLDGQFASVTEDSQGGQNMRLSNKCVVKVRLKFTMNDTLLS